MKFRNLLILSIGMLTISSCATMKKVKLADSLYNEGSYYNAVDAYEEVQQKKENNPRIAFQIAETNKHLKDYKQAEKWYLKTLELNEKVYPEARYEYAMMLKAQGKYDKASREFDNFIENVTDAGDDELTGLARRAKLEKQGCELANELIEAKPESVVEEIPGINNNLQDFSPKYINNNEVLMAALLPTEAVNLDEAREENEDYYSKLFIASSDGSEWSKELLPDNINVNEKHNGNGVLSRDGKTLYYTQCAEEDAHIMTCNIYKTVKSGSTWSDPEMVSINKKGATTTQPALGIDMDGNEVLYFASNRKGSKGGMDIWYATIEDGEFSTPSNLGPGINTKYNEVTPFYDNNNGLLYFSSEGHPGIGGLDVFKVAGNTDEWQEDVINAGYPLNSSADDLYLALNTSGTSGYLVSNRPGTTSNRGETCCDDVFKVNLVKDKFVVVEARNGSGMLMENVEVSTYKVLGENDFEFIGEGVTGADDVVFLLEESDYKINGNMEGYWPSIETLKTAEIQGSSRDTIVKVLIMRPINRAVVENVYFAFDKNDIREMYQDEMDTVIVLLNKYADLVVKVEGHTDSKGSDSYNLALSERRAKAAKMYLLEQGIAPERIFTQGFGETTPIAPNQNPDGSDNEEGRAKNRRVEFKLVNEASDEMPIEIEYESQEPETID